MTDASKIAASIHFFTFDEKEYPFKPISPKMLADLEVWVKGRRLAVILSAIPLDDTAERMAERMHVMKTFSLAELELDLEKELQEPGGLMKVLYFSAKEANPDLKEADIMKSLGAATKKELEAVVDVLTAMILERDGRETAAEEKKQIPEVGQA